MTEKQFKEQLETAIERFEFLADGLAKEIDEGQRDVEIIALYADLTFKLTDLYEMYERYK